MLKACQQLVLACRFAGVAGDEACPREGWFAIRTSIGTPLIVNLTLECFSYGGRALVTGTDGEGVELCKARIARGHEPSEQLLATHLSGTVTQDPLHQIVMAHQGHF